MLCPSLFSYPLADTHLLFCAESHSRICQEASCVENLKRECLQIQFPRGSDVIFLKNEFVLKIFRNPESPFSK